MFKMIRALAKKIRHSIVMVGYFIKVNYYRFMGVKIGKGTRISVHAYVDMRRGKISIGKKVAIASGSYILSHTGGRAEKGEVETIIEDNVRIFVNSVILPGVKIGRNSIVGAGSVVMKNIPPNVVVMGNPARVIQQLENKNNS